MDTLDPAKTVAIIVDLQWQFIDESSPLAVAGGQDLVKRSLSYVEQVRARGARTLYTASWIRPGVQIGRTTSRFAHKEINRDSWAKLADGVQPQDGDVVLQKPRQSAFFATDLDPVLRSFDCQNVVISGITSNVCCFATALDAAARDYSVFWVHDLIKALPISRPGFEVDAESVHRNTTAMVAYSVGEVCTAEEVLAALDRP